MERLTRRRFVLGSMLAGAVGPRWQVAAAAQGAFVPLLAVDDPLRGGTALETIPFLDESKRRFGQRAGSGLRARLHLDLSALRSATMVTPNRSFFVRTGRPKNLEAAQPWRVRVHGATDGPTSCAVSAMVGDPAAMGIHLLECSGNGEPYGLMSAASWSGRPVLEALKRAKIVGPPEASVLIGGFDDHAGNRHGISTPGASWIFTLAQLAKTGAFFATHMNGAPLPADHGAPLRLIVPGWYGCTCIKWVDTIRFVSRAAASTSQMREFASRTHQRGVPKLAREFRAADIDLAAMPIRVEKWRVEGNVEYRVIGIIWGGEKTTDALTIRLGRRGTPEPVTQANHQTNATWSLWSHRWRPTTSGKYTIRMSVNDPAIPTRRLDRGRYQRQVLIKND